MTDEKPPIKLELIAKKRAEETAARMAKYNASVLGGQLIQAPMKRLSDLSPIDLARISYIRGLMSCAENLWQESIGLSYSVPEWEIDAVKAKARERLKILEQVIELLKLIEEV